MSTVTAVVHTKNSAKTLEACLRSLTWCDAIFVIDMESTDETVAIAKKYKADIFHEKSVSFADPIRNTYLHKVKTEWTIVVDSDEEVPPTLAEKLQELMLTAGVNGFQVPRANMIFGKWIEHTGFWPDYIVRFFRTGKCTYPPYVHGQPVIEGVTQTIEPKKELALIHHHYDSIEQYLLRMNVYTSLEVEKYAQVPREFHFIKAFFAEFHRRFFSDQGYKDGSHGLVLSLLQAIYMLVVQLKLWEKAKKEMDISVDEIEHEVTDACSATTYWVANEKEKEEKNMVKKIGLQLRRKLSS